MKIEKNCKQLLFFLYLRFRSGVGSRRSQKSKETRFYLIEKSLTNRNKFAQTKASNKKNPESGSIFKVTFVNEFPLYYFSSSQELLF